jgi:large subunit ribosomal protein L30
MAKNLKITWIKSEISTRRSHRRTLKALGLRRLNQSIVKKDTHQLRGMIRAVNYLLKVEEER